MKLELKHISPYLPYSIGFKHDNGLTKLNIETINYWFTNYYLNPKPILRPLSDLTKEEWKEEVLIHYADLDIDIRVYNSGNDNKNDFGLSVTYKLMGEVFTDLLINRGSTRETPRHFMEWLYENHFDVDNLTENNIAIDINTIK